MMHWELLRYQLPFRAPMLMGDASPKTHREGLWLLCYDKEAFDGLAWGEIAPLPGFSLETLEEAQEQILSFMEKRAKVRLAFDEHWVLWQSLLEDQSPKLHPSVRFGLEMLYFNWERLCARKTTPFHLEVPKIPSKIKLLKLSDSALLEKITHFKEDKSIKEFKVKVSSKEEGGKLKLLLSNLREDQRIRLDANRLLTPREAKFLLFDVDIQKIAFFEEPLQKEWSITTLEAFSEEMGVPYALDERLRDMALGEIPWGSKNLSALVVKPTCQGSLSKLSLISEQCKTHKKRLIISSSHESPIGIHFLNALSHALPVPEPAGLDTLHFLSQRVLDASLEQNALDAWGREGYWRPVARCSFPSQP